MCMFALARAVIRFRCMSRRDVQRIISPCTCPSSAYIRHATVSAGVVHRVRASDQSRRRFKDSSHTWSHDNFKSFFLRSDTPTPLSNKRAKWFGGC